MARVAVMHKVAQAVATEINTQDPGSWALDLQPPAVFSYADWDEQLEDLDCLHVDVVPAGFSETEIDDRGDIAYLVQTDIGIRKRFTQDHQSSNTSRIELAHLAQLALLTEQLYEHFAAASAAARLPTLTQAVYSSSEIKAPYLRKHLRELRQWTSIISITHDYTKPTGAE